MARLDFGKILKSLIPYSLIRLIKRDFFNQLDIYDDSLRLFDNTRKWIEKTGMKPVLSLKSMFSIQR